MPLTPIPALPQTPEQRASTFAAQHASNFNTASTQHHSQLAPLENALKNGLPGGPNEPAVSAQQIATAFGAANVAKIQAILAALTA